MAEREYRIDYDQVRSTACGRWRQVYAQVAGFDDALKHAGKNRHVECPICSRKNFRLFKDYEETGGGICTCGSYPDGFMLLRAVWHFGPTQTYELFKGVADILGGDHSTPQVPPLAKQRTAPAKTIDHGRLKELRSVHGQLLLVTHPDAEPLRRYLVHRGLDPQECPADLMFHPGLPYLHERDDGSYEDLGTHPAMVGIVRTVRGDIITLHRTYLTAEGGKANVPEAKKLMPKAVTRSVAGCCIQLDRQVGSVLHLAEGIETGLSVRAMTREPTWVAISANFLPALVRPRSVERVVLWVDLDRSGAGHRFSQELADRLLSEGVTMQCHTPSGPIPLDAKSVDWNDIHRAQGQTGFPSPYNGYHWASEPDSSAIA